MMTLTEAQNHSEYSRIPPHILASVYDFVEHHTACGHFLTAVLTNNLFEAVNRADEESLESLRELVKFIHMEVPIDIYGTPAKVNAWLHKKKEHL